MEWSLEHPYLTFILGLVALWVFRCMFKAFGGGYMPRKHCEGCECGAVEIDDDEEDDA